MAKVRLNGDTSGFTEISAPTVAGSNTLVLPSGSGAAHQLLKNGSSAGSLDWGFTLPAANGSAHQLLKNSATPGTIEFGFTLPSTNGTNRQVLIGDGAGALTWQWDTGGFFYRSNTTNAGANSTAVQSIFGVGVTLAASTVYAFQAVYVFTKTAGATSHRLGVLFGGTATYNNALYTGLGTFDATALPATANTNVTNFIMPMQTGMGTSQDVTPNIATATVSVATHLTGTFSVNAGGTFIPQYQLSAAPGGAYTVQTGSYIRLVPIGAAGSASSQGTWA